MKKLRQTGTENDEAAFPVMSPSYSAGISMRDYFAAAALPAIIPCFTEETATVRGLANLAYAYADAMLEARKTL